MRRAVKMLHSSGVVFISTLEMLIARHEQMYFSQEWQISHIK